MNSATTPAQLDLLAAEATDADLRWRRLTRLAELDRLDDSEVDDLLAEDPNPDAWMSALQARTARPSADAKAEAWQVVVEDRIGDDVIEDLRRRGHSVTVSGAWTLGRLSAVSRDPETGILRAAANPRGNQGYAVGR